LPKKSKNQNIASSTLIFS